MQCLQKSIGTLIRKLNIEIACYIGYLYFHNAPDDESFFRETVSRVKNLHLADCLRANKSTMAWSVEVRVPFLDESFLDYSMELRAADKVCPGSSRIEKEILRRAFDFDRPTDDGTGSIPFLPREIVWRQKEQFSDGVGYDWITSLKARASESVTDAQFEARHKRWSVENGGNGDIPDTKEAYHYREIFDEYFGPACSKSVSRWIPRADWGMFLAVLHFCLIVLLTRYSVL